MKTYKTAKGSELPLLNLRGKDYLEVKYRIVWFRQEHPDWTIETEYHTITNDAALAKAFIKNAEGRVICTSHKFENAKGFPDFLEKAETGAIGRALALIGYGTQFCADEFDEGKRIVDSPVTPKGAVGPEQPEPGDGIQKEGYHFPAIAGKYAMMHEDSVSDEDLLKMLDKMDEKYGDRELPPKTLELYINIKRILNRREKAAPQNEDQ